MTAALLASFFFAAVAAVGVGGLYLAWPRGMSAEEWVLRRRAAVLGPAPAQSAGGAPRLGRRMSVPHLERFQFGVEVVKRDLSLLRLERVPVPASEDVLFARLLRLASIGAGVGLVAGLVIWIAPGRNGLPSIVVLLTVGLAALVPGLEWLRFRRRAEQLRSRIRRQLPRLLTGARTLLESGATTPQQALSMSVAVYSDPAADVLREALRMREVRQLELEVALDRVGHDLGLESLRRLADSFRVGSRFGTPMSNLITEVASSLRQGWHAEYRERINRAPVLMTVPAMVFFVLPLLALILLLVFTPLMKTLSEL